MSSWHIKDLLALLLLGSILPDLSVSQGNKNPCTYTNIFHKKLGLILSWIGCIFVNKKPVWSECNHGEYTHKNTALVTKQELQEEISFGVCNGLLLGQTHSFSSSSSSLFPAPHIYNVLNSSKIKLIVGTLDNQQYMIYLDAIIWFYFVPLMATTHHCIFVRILHEAWWLYCKH